MAMTIASVVALSFVVAGCAPAESSTSTPEPETTVTTEWTAPADPEADGPTEAPALTEESGALDEPITLSTGVVVEIEKLSTVEVEPETPGEYAGTAVVVTLSVSNGSDQAQSIDSAVVTLSADDGDVGIATTSGPHAPLQGDLAPDASVEATYVFMLDQPEGRSVTISVNYAAGEPVAHFSGVIP